MSLITRPIPSDYDEITQLWEASVRSSHHFLSKEDIGYYRPLVREIYLPATELYIIRSAGNRIAAFMGLSEACIEMLFVHPDEQGKGYGRQLIRLATEEKHIGKVDVNEQNETAFRFYRHLGFNVTGRDETDAEGKPFPILHMELDTALCLENRS